MSNVPQGVVVSVTKVGGIPFIFNFGLNALVKATQQPGTVNLGSDLESEELELLDPRARQVVKTLFDSQWGTCIRRITCGTNLVRPVLHRDRLDYFARCTATLLSAIGEAYGQITEYHLSQIDLTTDERIQLERVLPAELTLLGT